MAKAISERKLSGAERELARAKAEVARLRRRLPRTVVHDYSLAGAARHPVKLSALFGRHRDLILIPTWGGAARIAPCGPTDSTDCSGISRAARPSS